MQYRFCFRRTNVDFVSGIGTTFPRLSPARTKPSMMPKFMHRLKLLPDVLDTSTFGVTRQIYEVFLQRRSSFLTRKSFLLFIHCGSWCIANSRGKRFTAETYSLHQNIVKIFGASCKRSCRCRFGDREGLVRIAAGRAQRVPSRLPIDFGFHLRLSFFFLLLQRVVRFSPQFITTAFRTQSSYHNGFPGFCVMVVRCCTVGLLPHL